MCVRLILGLWVILAVLARPGWADEAQDAFDRLYGNDLKRVAATPSAADDVALAKQLLEGAKAVEKQPAFLAILCDKAYELGAKDPTGYDTALAAMGLEADSVPDKRVECLTKVAALYQGQYAKARGDAKAKVGEALVQALMNQADAEAAAGSAAAADTARQALAVAAAIKSESRATVQAWLSTVGAREETRKQVAALKAKLLADPKDSASRKELVRLLLVEEDDPAEAAKYVDESLDEPTRKCVPGAAKGVEVAPEPACQELGKWYQDLADQAASPGAKAAMLGRARRYWERFLELHSADDLDRTVGTLALKKIDGALAGIGRGPVSGRAPLPVPLRKGLVLFYTFDRNESGKVTDLSGSGNHGKVQGAQWTSEGKVAGAYRFEAAKKTQGILVPNTGSLGVKRITMAAWIRTTQQDGTWGRIMDKDFRKGYNLCLGGEFQGRQWRGQAGVEINDHAVFKGRVADGQWHHVLATYDGKVQRLYIDAKPVGQVAWAGDIGVNPYDLAVGNSSIPYGTGELLAFDGLIDEAMIWSRALSEEEVQQVYAATGGK